jgi:hypothetical protein
MRIYGFLPKLPPKSEFLFAFNTPIEVEEGSFTLKEKKKEKSPVSASPAATPL